MPLRDFVLAPALRDRAWVRIRTLWACGLGLLAGMAVCADMSDAAIVELRSPGGGDFVRYVAGPGERNELTFAHIGTSMQAVIRVHDPGATVRVGSRCVSEDVHTAVCSGTSPSLYQFYVTLGDGDDVLHPAGFNLMKANGGLGNDRLLGGTWDDRLDGGGGRDELRGGDGADVLSDGDRDAAHGDGKPGRDILDGGPGADEVTYKRRTRAVSVDLGDNRPDGARGERDLVLDVESVTGGRGNDLLVGDRTDNILSGGRGRNRLIGLGGDDALINPSSSKVSCGTGTDVVTAPRASTVIPRTCEDLRLPLPRPFISDTVSLTLSPYPERESGRIGFHLGCPETDGEPLLCAADVRIHERSSGRLLARGSILPGRWLNRFLRLRLTSFGRQVLKGNRRTLATAGIRGQSMPKAGWTIQF